MIPKSILGVVSKLIVIAGFAIVVFGIFESATDSISMTGFFIMSAGIFLRIISIPIIDFPHGIGPGLKIAIIGFVIMVSGFYLDISLGYDNWAVNALLGIGMVIMLIGTSFAALKMAGVKNKG